MSAADLPTYLVASATAKTGTGAVHALSESGKVRVRALTRNPDSDAAKALAALPNTEVVKGDFTDAASIKAALAGVKRVFMVSPAGDESQYDVEAGFIKAAVEAGVEGIFRVSTASILIHIESEGVYARAHARVEKFIEETKAPVVDGNPNWFFHNLMLGAAQAKAEGKISWPVPGDGRPFAMVDPRDVGAAGAAILLQDSDKFAEFLKLGRVEIHGPETKNFGDQVKAIAEANGKPLELELVTPEAYTAALVGFGMSEHMAKSLTATIEKCAATQETAGRPRVEESTPLLLEIWQPKHNLASWTKDFAAVFA